MSLYIPNKFALYFHASRIVAASSYIFGCAKKCAGCQVHSCSGSLADISQQTGVTGRDRGGGAEHRVHTEWQWSLSGVHSIIPAQSGESGGCTPTLFYYIYHHVQSCGVRSCWEVWYAISPLPLYVLCGSEPVAEFWNGKERERDQREER